jgi:hypothetical protein
LFVEKPETVDKKEQEVKTPPKPKEEKKVKRPKAI